MNARMIAAVIAVLLMTSILAGQTAPATGPVPTQPARPEGIPKEWVLVTAGTAFTSRAPADLKETPVQGVDSFVGKYQSPTMALTFDYGWWSNKLDDPKYVREAITLDGKPAFLARWDGGLGIYVPDVAATPGLKDTVNKLQMSIACDKATMDQAILLLRSIRFIVPQPAAAARATKAADARPAGIAKDWVLMTNDAFSFWGPATLKEEKIQAMDTYLDHYKSPGMTIELNYGFNAGPTNEPDRTREEVTIDGRPAVLIRWDGGVGLYVPRVADVKGLPHDGWKLNVSITCDKATVDQAILLLRSIRFTAPLPAATAPAK